MEALEILQRVKSQFGDRVLEISEKKPDPFAVIDPGAIVEVGRFMHEDPELAMDCLSNQSGVDYKERIEVVYHLFSYARRHGAVLKVKLPRDNPSVATSTRVRVIGSARSKQHRAPRGTLTWRFAPSSPARREREFLNCTPHCGGRRRRNPRTTFRPDAPDRRDGGSAGARAIATPAGSLPRNR